MTTYQATIVSAIARLREVGGSTEDVIKQSVQSRAESETVINDRLFSNTMKDMVASGEVVHTNGRYEVAPKRRCFQCGIRRIKAMFTERMWNKIWKQRECLECQVGRFTHKLCRLCFQSKPADAYNRKGWAEFCCRDCEVISFNALVKGFLCPLLSWTKIQTGQLPYSYYEECDRCYGEGYDSDCYAGYDSDSDCGSPDPCFQCNGRGSTDEAEPIDDNCMVSMQEQKPSMDDLIANEYSIIMIVCKERIASRTSEGFFFFCREIDGNLSFFVEGGSLRGVVRLEEGHGRSIGTECDLELLECSQEEVNEHKVKVGDDEARDEYLSIPSNAIAIKTSRGDCMDANRLTGMIQMVATRTVLPRCKDMRNAPRLREKLPHPCSIEEGDTLMTRYKNVGSSWLCSKLSLPEEATFLVREFLRPRPVFFLEPGDIWIRSVEIGKQGRKDQPVLLVARSKK